jgi:predicted dehydrogenase
MRTHRITRRTALKAAAAGFGVPLVFRHHVSAAPSETLRHASFGAGGMAAADINSLTASKNLQLVAVADVDLSRAEAIKKKFPNAKIYQDWRELLDKEKGLDSVSVSTPDHMHAPMTMAAIHRGLHVYTQKPLTQTVYESRQLAKAAAAKKVVSQMGIQVHSAASHKSIVATVRGGAIGKVKAVYSWSGKEWGDPNPRPVKSDPVPKGFDWNGWLGVAAERPFIGGGYYHPGNWRKRLDFGTGTFGDMGCHILDPVFNSLGVKYAKSVKSVGESPNAYNWPLNCEVVFTFPGSDYTTETVTVTWYNGNRRPPSEIAELVKPHTLPHQGSIYIGTEGVLFSPYGGGRPELMGAAAGKAMTQVGGDDHYLQWVEACRGNGKTSAGFDYSGPLTEMVLLGCLATRFPEQTLEWDANELKVTNVKEANQFVRREYRKGWAIDGL